MGYLKFFVTFSLFLAHLQIPQVQGKPFDFHLKETSNVCETEGCKKTADRLLNSLNRSVNPCEDFYEYSCGNWIKNNPRPATSSRWSQFSIISEKLNDHIQEILTAPIETDDVKALTQVKKFYSACKNLDSLNSKGLQQLAKVVQDHGGFPLIERENWTESNFELQSVIARLRRDFGFTILAEFSVRPDMKNTDRSVISIDQPEFSLARNILLHPEKFEARLAAYKKFLHDAVLELNTHVNSKDSKIDEDYLKSRIEEIVQFETKLANVSATGEERRSVQNVYHPFKLQDFQSSQKTANKNSPINWKEMLVEIFDKTHTIDDNQDIIVMQPNYLSKMTEILTDTPAHVIANYVQWRVFSSLLGETTDRMRQIEFDFVKVMTGLKEPPKREVKCSSVEMSSSYYLLGYAVGVKYIEKFFPPEAKENVNEMVGYLRAAFEQFLQESDWMDESTKEKAFSKIKAMSQFIAYPDWMKNNSAVDEYFQDLEVKEDDHFQNHLNFLRWESRKGLKTLGQPPKRDEMDSHPVYVNAMYTPEMNSITFPAGILAPPFFSHDSPASINFGGVGVVIGHEVTHGFDDEGSQYDAKGNAEDWWSSNIKEEFNKRAKCMIEEYSAFQTPYGNVNGALTAGENIADNGGLRQAYQGYQNWIKKKNQGTQELSLPGLEDLTPEQLFFLGYSTLWCQNISPEAEQNQLMTDVHSPGRFRVLGALMNSENFAAAWNCPKNSVMNPDHKCKLW